MQYEYLTVPFVGQTKQGDKHPSNTLADQLCKLINERSRAGWEFHRIDHVSLVMKNGCLAGLAGNPYTVTTHDIVIFRKAAKATG